MAKNIRVLNRSVSLPYGLWKYGLTPKAIGLLYTILGLADIPEWEFSVRGLCRVFANADVKKGIGLEAITSGIQELEEKRFLIRERVRGKDGQLGGSNWIVSEAPIPTDAPETGCPATGLPATGNPAQEKPTQYINPIEEKKNNKQGEIIIPETGSNKRKNKSSRDNVIFTEAVREIWNSEAPDHWPRITAIGPQRLRRVSALVAEVGGADEALEALSRSLRAAHGEGWCMKPEARLSIENWLSNGKVVQYSEKAQQEPVVSVSVSQEQIDMINLARRHKDLFGFTPYKDGVELRFTKPALDIGYPETSRIRTLDALEYEIACLTARLDDHGHDVLPCPW